MGFTFFYMGFKTLCYVIQEEGVALLFPSQVFFKERGTKKEKPFFFFFFFFLVKEKKEEKRKEKKRKEKKRKEENL